jgi:hypothetical protein
MIQSVWAATPPTIDGRLALGEYGDPQIVFSVPPYNSSFLNASIYFANDASKLHVMVDAVGDQTNDRGDENLLVFNYPNWTWVEFWGIGGKRCTTYGSGCYVPKGVIAAVGYDISLNGAHRHKIYELSIPLETLNATAGQALDFCSPKKPMGASISYDDSTGRDNPWPDGLIFDVDANNVAHTDVNTWGILSLASNAIAEFPNPLPLVTSVLVLACSMLISWSHRKRTSRVVGE